MATRDARGRFVKTGSQQVAPTPWEHDFLFIRSADEQGRSYGGFQWPREAGAEVVAPDWSPNPVCGGGLHGLEDGLGDWALMKAPADHDALWYVCGAMRSEAVPIDDDKIKVPRCRVLYVGSFAGAMERISPAMTSAIQALVKTRTAEAKSSRGAATASGYRGAATASGYSGAATASGLHGVALAAGYASRAKAFATCLLVLVERDGQGVITGHFASMVGDNGVKPDTWYTLANGRLVEVV